MITVAAPLIAAASNQKIFFGQLATASIQEQPLIKKKFYRYTEVDLNLILPIYFITFIINLQKKSSKIGHGAASI